ncbi:hypothetical protein ACWD5Q_20700 [Streptomyces sp. NPDC002513]
MAWPEGWDWLDELPIWDPPEELRGPVRPVAINLAIKMLSCDILSNEVRVLVGGFVAEYSLYNLWFLRDAKASGKDARQLARFSGLAREQTRLVYESWQRFQDATSSQGEHSEVRKSIQLRSQELSEALSRAVDVLRDAKSSPQ